MYNHHSCALRNQIARLALVSLFVLVTLIALPASAAERILSYHSDIEVHADASMTVTETIRVQAEGQQIQRGIYRDFPTAYEDAYGNDFNVLFEPISVQRNGAAEPWHTQGLSNGVRVYAGAANQLLSHGVHTYQISYRTDRQLGYFETHDELYWNVNGNGWDFAIEQLSATVRLPQNIPLENVTMSGYVGAYGASEGAWRTGFDGNGITIHSTRALGPGEGLTLVATWPKGQVHEPSQLERFALLLKDNTGLLLALLAFVCSGIFLYRVWARHGKDPEPGPIFAHYEPPPGFSPAATRYIHRLGYDNAAFSAAVVNLAVQGYLQISNDGDDYEVIRSPEQPPSPPSAPGEAALFKRLFRKHDRVELDNDNHRTISGARSAHKKALHRNYAGTYFVHNTLRVWPSFAGTIITIMLIAALQAVTPAAIVMLIANAVTHAVFIYLLKAPTRKGRGLMDQLEGFKLYLQMGEKDDLNLKHPPDRTPKLFEAYLPFAIALGVEQSWADQFTRIFEGISDQQGGAYRPTWYHGHFNHRAPASFAQAVGSELSSVVSSAATPPGSSSGSGGGGFSGGGGGGGGGGGW